MSTEPARGGDAGGRGSAAAGGRGGAAAGDGAPAWLAGLHHVGASVASLDAALAFWEPFLGRPARFRGVLDRPYLGASVGYPGVAIEAALVDLPGGALLELLDYRVAGRAALPDATASPGNVHLCLRVHDARAAWERAAALGARPVRAAGPVAVDAGPNAGALVAYLRIHDGVSLELFQPPAA